MTTQERRACFQHAKKHVLEAIKEAIHEEAHSVFTVDDKFRPDMLQEIINQMHNFWVRGKHTKYEDRFNKSSVGQEIN